MDYRIIDKYFSKEDNLFHILRENTHSFKIEDKKYTLG